MLYGTEDSAPASGDDGIMQEAVERFKECQEWQGVQDEYTREDIKFANADARNAQQWPRGLYDQRTSPGNDLPCLTINNTRTHNDMVINTLSKNGFGAKVRPIGGKASYKSAQVMQNIINRIQYISKSASQRRKVIEHMVDGGIGYMMLETKFVSERSFDQDIYLKAASDPTGVYLDRWSTEPDGSDSNYGFVFSRMSRKEFNRKHPKWKNKVGFAPISSMFSSWISDKEIMVGKYYRKKEKSDTLVCYKMEDGSEVEKLASEIKKEAGNDIYDSLMEQIKEGTLDGRTRKVKNNEVEWFLFAGDKIIERGDWPGKYIPICRAVGREIVVDGTLDRKGHTRPLIDAQRMLNFNASTSVQVVALQPKSPWLAAARAIEGQEQWKDANINNYAVLLYNDVDDEAPGELQNVAPPQRIDPPKASTAHLQGMQDAERQMMMISGQFQAQMGENDTQSAASGTAISQRKQQGDIATYHFTDHITDMDRNIGVQLLDLIPKIYDSDRALQIIGDNGEKQWIMINPKQDTAVQELDHIKDDEEAIRLAFNPSLGEYECVSEPAVDYASQRQEAWDSISMILQQNMQLAATIGDLLFQYADFPGAESIRERLMKEIKATKPYLFDDNVEPQMVALQQQAQRLTAMNADLMTKLADANIKTRGRDEKRDIEAFNAETNRMKVQVDMLAKMLLTPQQQATMEHELSTMGHQHVFDMISAANAASVQSQKNGAAE